MTWKNKNLNDPIRLKKNFTICREFEKKKYAKQPAVNEN